MRRRPGHCHKMCLALQKSCLENYVIYPKTKTTISYLTTIINTNNSKLSERLLNIDANQSLLLMMNLYIKLAVQNTHQTKPRLTQFVSQLYIVLKSTQIPVSWIWQNITKYQSIQTWPIKVWVPWGLGSLWSIILGTINRIQMWDDLEQASKESHEKCWDLGLRHISISGITSYDKIAWSLEATALVILIMVSLWYLPGFSTASVSKCWSNLNLIWQISIQTHGLDTLQDLTITYVRYWHSTRHNLDIESGY